MNQAGTGARMWITSQPWRLWGHQIMAIVRQELKHNFFTRRGTWIYLLAFGPVVVFAIAAIQTPGCAPCSLDEDTSLFAATFQLYYMRFGIFFGVMGIFAWLFR